MTLPVLLLLASIGLRGQTVCPTVEQVSARLDGLDKGGAGPLRWVELRADADHLQLSLWSPQGFVEAVRELPLQASCDALAKASAVTIATWALRPVAPSAPAPAVEPPPERRIFDAATLAAERMRLERIVTPPPPPDRVLLRGPFTAMGIGALCAALSPLVAMAAPSAGSASMGMFAISAAAFTSGVFWLVMSLGRASFDAQIVF